MIDENEELLDDDLLSEDEALPPTGEPEGGETLYEHRRVVADRGQNPMRVDKFLMDHLGDTSRNRIQKAAEAGISPRGHRVNGNHVILNEKELLRLPGQDIEERASVVDGTIYDLTEIKKQIIKGDW